MTPLEVLVQLANCTSTGATPAIANVLAGPVGISDVASSSKCCNGGGYIAVELVDVSDPEERTATGMPCEDPILCRARITLGRCYSDLEIGAGGYAAGGAVNDVTFTAESDQFMADAVRVLVSTRTCLAALFNDGEINPGHITRQTYRRSKKCARVVTEVEWTMPLCS